MAAHIAFLTIVGGGIGSAADTAAGTTQERLYSPTELRADFEQMYRRLQEAHFDLYAYTPKSELDRYYEQSLSQLKQPLTQFQAKIAFELFVAKARMGHTRMDSPLADWRSYRAKGGRGFPLSIRVVDDHVYVTENLSGVDGIQPGDEITALNGESMRGWLERTERHVSAETAYMAHSLMEYDFATYVWVELGEADGFDVDVRRPGASSRRVHLPARTSGEMDAVSAKQGPGLNLESPLREAKMLDANVAYLRPGPFYNTDAKTAADEWDVSGFRQFIDGAFESFAKARAKGIIVDLRGNPGGDNLFSDVMVSWFATKPFRFASQFKVKVSAESTAANEDRIAHDAVAAGPISRQFADLYAHAQNGDSVDFNIPLAYPNPKEHFAGKVFVLIDRQCYSNSVAVAATVQDYKFGSILGEPTSDMATTYGAMEQFVLPITGLKVGYPKARIVRPNGDLHAKGVTPDRAIRIPVVQTPADEVLRQAQRMAAGR